MPISTKSQEQISEAYVLAVAAQADAVAEVQNDDSFSGDVRLAKEFSKQGHLYNAEFKVQLKTVWSDNDYSIDSNGDIKYRLKAKNYRDLTAGSNFSTIIALLILPKDESNWVKQTTEELIIKKCMFWEDISNLPETSNEESVTIALKADHVFTKDAIDEIFREIVA